MFTQVTNCNKIDLENKLVNESLTTELERYNERVKTFEQRLNVDLSSREKLIDSQMDDMIRNRNALKQEINSLKQTFSKQVKEKESLLQTFTIFKKESKEKENKYINKEIDLEKKIKELDNIVYKVGQSAQKVHMLTKPQVFYGDTHKQALGYQNLFYLKKAQWIKPTLYDGIVISKKHDVISMGDEEETLILEEEKINISLINYSELNRLSEDFRKCFVPQMQLSAEQAFWLLLSNPKSEQLVVNQTPVEIEVLKELRVHECSVDEKYFDIQKKELSLDNDRLLDHIICQDVMNIVMHAASVPVNVVPSDNKCLVNDNLEIERSEQENDYLFELLLSQDIVHICVNPLAARNNCREMQQSFINEYNENLVLKAELAKRMVENKFFDEVVLRCSQLKNRGANLELILQHQKESFLNNRSLNNQNAPEILEFFKINEWQSKIDAKDVSIANLRKHIKSLKGKNVVEKMSNRIIPM
ncbi:hypothetical protein Tco_1077810 [Tanacetum coccineum]